MRLVVLTTETTHHSYFVKQLNRDFPLRVIAETEAVKPAFDTSHDFEKIRDSYEKDFFFNGDQPSLAEIAPTSFFRSINEPEAIACLRDFRPEVVVVFGTGRLKPAVIEICPEGIVNLHGGDPEEYRGLDSHLWAIYHRDFAGLLTTLHRLNRTLDDGEIIAQQPVPISAGMNLAQLRARNTENCLALVRSALAAYQITGRFLSRPQKKSGRYYSFMPAALKEICVKRFLNFI